MKHFKALVISDQNTTAKILNWKLDTVKNVEDALAILRHQDYRIIAVDNTIEKADRQKLEAIAKLFNNEVSVISFSTDGELMANIGQAFRNQRAASLSHKFLDNAFEMELACKINMN